MNARILTHAESAEWEEYLRLKKEGLLLKLPCVRWEMWFTKFKKSMKGFGASQLEKTVFLSESEAQEALRKMEGV